MKIVIVGGTLGSGKTALLGHVALSLQQQGFVPGVFKIDTQANADERTYRKRSIIATTHWVDTMCPDHEAMSVIEKAWDWACASKLDVLIIETAGLCFRCAPFLERPLAFCVISGLMNIGTPDKIGPMLTKADCVVLSKVDGIGQAEREVLLEKIRLNNTTAVITYAHGLTGEGTGTLTDMIVNAPDIRSLSSERLRASLPKGYCHHCHEKG